MIALLTIADSLRLLNPACEFFTSTIVAPLSIILDPTVLLGILTGNISLLPERRSCEDRPHPLTRLEVRSAYDGAYIVLAENSELH